MISAVYQLISAIKNYTPLIQELKLTVLLSSRSGLGLEDLRRHHLEVLALASDGHVLALDSKTSEKS